MFASVPKGSKISPLLFSLYMSDVPTTANTKISLYAKYSAIYSSSKQIENVTESIQTHLNEIQKLKIVLNPSNSTLILFLYV